MIPYPRLAPLAALFLMSSLTAGCQSDTGSAGAQRPQVPFADCGTLTTTPSATGGTPQTSETTRPQLDPLPEISLPCYTDGTPVEVAALRGPAVVNMWASWCAPCRRELPALRDFAAGNVGRVRVLGVVSTDSRAASSALAQELELTFPHLFDEGGELLRRLGRTALPVTLFVDARGQIAMVYAARALDRDTLDQLVNRRLGVLPA